MTDVTERLIRAWIRWETFPSSRDAVVEKLAAIAAAGLPSSATHRLIGRERRAGRSIPDAVQTAVNELAPSREAA